ncbi:MAG: DUF1838 family protein [Pseudomonadota bacterium]|nr:DUF1838 family protein [Pseudomonadota bacterium]
MSTGGLLLNSLEGALPEASSDILLSGNVDLEKPEVNLAGFIRMMASLEEVDVPWWYNGTVYAVLGETKNPQPLFRFSGMELYLVTKLQDNTYELTGNTVTFFSDMNNNWINDFQNPFTGKLNKVEPATQGGGPGRGFNLSVNGVRFSSMKDKIPDKPLKKWWSVAADRVWMNNDTVYPPGLAAPRAQSQSVFANVADFNDPNLPKLSAVFSSSVTMPWLQWMMMEDEPGHLLWHAAGTKLPSVDALPKEYRKRIDAEYPERLSVARS